MKYQLLSLVSIAWLSSPELGATGEINREWISADPTIECAAAADKDLCANLLALGDRDQIIRHHLLAKPNDKALLAEMAKADTENLSQVEAIIDKRGWPGTTLVGERASGAAWTIIQHGDLPAQERLLPLMQEASRTGELHPSLLALTVDRIRLRRGQPQIYGTQFHEVKGRLVPEEIEHPSQVDQRRASVGLPPLAEYETLINQYYSQPASAAPSPHP